MSQLIRASLALVLLLCCAAAQAGPREEVLASYEAMMKFGKFRMSGSTTSGKDEVAVEGAVVWPDRFHMKSQGGEFIIIPGGTYMRQGGVWQKLPMDMSAMARAMSPDQMKQSFDNMTNVKDLGTESLDGRATRVYEYDTHLSTMGVTIKSHNKIWIDAGTKLPLRQDSDADVMGQRSKSSHRYEFDAALKIDAPI